jgi:hypothetical protein
MQLPSINRENRGLRWYRGVKHQPQLFPDVRVQFQSDAHC